MKSKSIIKILMNNVHTAKINELMSILHSMSFNDINIHIMQVVHIICVS